jgi:hypothetical protein
MVDHDSANSGAQRIAQIEDGDVQARGQVPTGPTGLLRDVYLQGRHRGEGSGAQEAHEDHGCGLAVNRHRHETQHRCERGKRTGQRGAQAMVGETSAQ